MARRLQPYRLSPAHRNGLGRRPKGKPLVGSRGSAPGRVQGAEPLASKVAAGTDSLLGATLGRSEARHLDLCNQPRRSAQSAVSAPTAAYSRLRSTSPSGGGRRGSRAIGIHVGNRAAGPRPRGGSKGATGSPGTAELLSPPKNTEGNPLIGGRKRARLGDDNHGQHSRQTMRQVRPDPRC